MADHISDGKGRGFLAAVNAENQMITRATAVEQRLASATDNNYFEVTTGPLTLTDAATENEIIYMDNADTNNRVIVIDRVFYDIWTSTGAPGVQATLRYYVNPTETAGTGTAIIPTNTNFGSTVAAVGTFKSGGTTIDIFSGGVVWWTAYITDSISVALEEGRIVIPNGSSFGISVVTPLGNTSMAVSINVAFYYLNVNLIE